MSGEQTVPVQLSEACKLQLHVTDSIVPIYRMISPLLKITLWNNKYLHNFLHRPISKKIVPIDSARSRRPEQKGFVAPPPRNISF